MSQCPCGSGRTYEECCCPYIEGQENAPTAEALMRSRFTAHALHKFEYLNETVLPEMRDENEFAEMQQMSQIVTWTGLDILSASRGGEDDESGEVSFEAHYEVKGVPQTMREDAFFRREDGRWYYVDGNVHRPEPYRREGPKIGRNDPCPCGSGKKYKKCCGKNR